MLALTSISPTHINKDIQSKAVQSWIDCGMKVYSFNNKSECVSLSPLYPDVTFIETNRTMEHIFRKPYVSISAIFDWCKTQAEGYYCLINSDIELKMDQDTRFRIQDRLDNNELVLANRVNYVENYQGSRYLAGIDVFFLNQSMINSYPQNVFCLGQCFFDYFIPYWASQKGFDLTFLKQDIAFHKEHPAQYRQEDWVKTGHHFLWLTDLYQFSNQIGRMSKHVYDYIYTAAKRVAV